MLEGQKRFVDSCQRVQLDDPSHVADVLDKLIEALINKYVFVYFLGMSLNSYETSKRSSTTY